MNVAKTERLQRQIKALESISPQDFASIWQSSDVLASAVGFMSAICGVVLSPSVVGARATAYRNKGLILKQLK